MNPHPHQETLASSTETVTICPHGLGNCGDNVSPNGHGNQSLHHTTRSARILFMTLQISLL